MSNHQSSDSPLPVTTTESPANRHDENKTRTFPCEACGADLTFNIGTQRLKCPYCGHEKQIALGPDQEVVEHDYQAMLTQLAEQRDKVHTTDTDVREVTCKACGAVVRFVGTLTSKECAYCGTPIQLDSVRVAEHRVPVDAVLPFDIPREQAHEQLARWVRSRWFAPNDFKQCGVQGRFIGMYLPYWTFDTLTFTRYTGQRGEVYTVTVGSGKNRRTETRVRWYPASGSFQRFFDDVLVVASTGLPNKHIQDLEPWNLRRCAPYNQEMLAGFLARTYNIELPIGFTLAKQRIDQQIEQDVRDDIGGDEQRIDSIQSRYDAITYKHLLLPVWMMTYRYHDRPYQILINADTGEVQGDRPYSWIKITLAVLAALIVIAIVALAHFR